MSRDDLILALPVFPSWECEDDTQELRRLLCKWCPGIWGYHEVDFVKSNGPKRPVCWLMILLQLLSVIFPVTCFLYLHNQLIISSAPPPVCCPISNLMPRNSVASPRRPSSWQPKAWCRGGRNSCWTDGRSPGRPRRQWRRPTTTQTENITTYGDKSVSLCAVCLSVCLSVRRSSVRWWSHPCAHSISFVGMWRPTWSSDDCCVNGRLGSEETRVGVKVQI